MPRQRPDLKKRLDQIREANERKQPVELLLSLDALLYNTLQRLAAERGQMPADCARDLIAAALDQIADESQSP